MNVAFEENPRLEWHHGQPFAVARLPLEYAQALARLALRNEEQIKALPVTEGWKKAAEANPTGSRYSRYNTFLLDPLCLPLFLALRGAYRFLLRSTGREARPRFVQSWYNVHRAGQNLHRHSHAAPFIGAFAACAEGSQTAFGPFPMRTEHDHAFENRDGQLIVTTGPNNYHEVSVWTREDTPRVSYAFDIVDAEKWKGSRVLLPFDGDGFDAPAP